MKKVHSVLLGIFLAFFCCLSGFSSANAKGVLGFCLSDCSSISDAQADSISNKLLKGDVSAFYGDYSYYQENSHCDTCNDNATKIVTTFQKNCASQKCTTNGVKDDSCVKQKCSNISKALLEGQKQGLQEQSKTLSTVDSALTTAMKVTDVVCTTATAAFGAALVLGTGAAALSLLWPAISVLGVGVTAAAAGGTAGLVKGLSGGATYPLILNAFLTVGGSGCWFCPIFDTIYNAANTLATGVYTGLRGTFLSLLALGGFAWILFTIFKFLTTIHGPNIGELMTTLFKGLGTMMLVSIFLMPSPSFITGYLVDVPANVALGLSGDILSMSGFLQGDTITYQTNTSGDSTCPLATSTQIEQSSQSYTVKLCEKSDSSDYTGKILSAQLHDEFTCLLKRVSAEMMIGMAIGATFITEGFTANLLGFLPSFPMLFAGLVMFISYFALFIMIPFKLIDLILRICFVVILLPIFVICFAFPATRGYTKKGWDLFLSCWVTLVALCVFITFSIALISAVFTTSTSSSGSSSGNTSSAAVSTSTSSSGSSN